MADYQQIVDRIRASIQSGEPSGMGTPSELAEAYARGCAEANERLHRCARYLQQGLRPEAIQQADLEPNLLNLVAILDFPERAEWDELTAEDSLPRAQALNLDAARAVNEAYATLAPLLDLHRHQRRLALAQAPLSQRLALLRSITEQDHNNPIWAEDVAAYEKARLAEVSQEAAAVIAREDDKTLETLLAELEGPDWLESPPQSMILTIRKELARLRKLRARRRLEGLVGDLVAAFDAMDLEMGRLVRDRWEENAHEAALTLEDPLLARATPALEWVEVADRREQADRAYQQSVDELREALDQGDADRNELADLADAVQSLGRALPPDLPKRLQERMAELARAQRRHMATVVVGASAFVLVVGLTLFVVLRERTREQEVTQCAGMLSQSLDEDDLETAVAFRDRLAAHVLDSPRMAPVFERLNAAIAKEKQRKDGLAVLIEELESQEADQPEPANMPKIREMIRLDADRTAVVEALGKWTKRYEDKVREDSQGFLSRIAALQSDVEKLEVLARGPDDSARVLDEATKLADSIRRRLADTSALVSNDARKPANELLARVEAVGKTHRALQEAARMEVVLTKASITSNTDPGPYADALKSYADRFKDSSRGKNFKQVLREQPAWGGAMAWSGSLGAWLGKPLLVLTPQVAAKRMKECETLLSTYPNLPDKKLVSAYRDYLAAIARRTGDKNKKKGVREELEALYQEPMASELRVVTVTGGKRYYFYKKFTPGITARTYECIVDFSGKTKPVTIVPNSIIEDDAPAPQCAIATLARGVLPTKPWEQATLEILKALYEPNPKQVEFDPLERFYLLKMTAEYAAKGSGSLEVALDPLIQAMKQSDIETLVFWMNPDDVAATTSRAKATKFLRTLSPFAEIVKNEAAYRATLEQDLGHRRVPIGWLAKQAEGWQCRSTMSVAKDTTLWVVDAGSGPAAKWKQIGTASGDGFTIRSSDPAVEGSLIFVENRPADRVRTDGDTVASPGG